MGERLLRDLARQPQGLAFADLYEAAQYVWDWMMTPVKAIQETNMSL
jgi:hypothetical protein